MKTKQSLPSPPFKISFTKSNNNPSNVKEVTGKKRSSSTKDNNVNAEVGNEAEIVTISSYKQINQGPYPEDQPPRNSVRFTSTQVSAIRSGVNTV